jgi:putative ABC transport system permease protein
VLTALVVALRAIWWRRGASAVILLVAVFAVATAAAGPLFLQGSGESILRATLEAAPGTTAGTGIEVSKFAVGRSGSDPLVTAVAHASAGTALDRLYGRHLVALERATRLRNPGGEPGDLITMVYRDDVCRHLRLMSGRCIGTSSADEMVVADPDARRHHWRLGSRVVVDAFRDTDVSAGRNVDPGPPIARQLTVVGTYQPLDPAGRYWFNDSRSYFGGEQRRQEQVTGAKTRTLDAGFVNRQPFQQLTASQSTSVLVVDDLLLDTGAVRRADTAGLRVGLDKFGVRLLGAQLAGRGYSNAVATNVRAALDTADARVEGLRRPILVVIGELVLISLCVLFLAVASAAEARGGEVALAKLRGLPTSATLSFGLLETVLLLVLALPLGAGLAQLLVAAAAPTLFGAGLVPSLTGPAWTAAAIAAGGGAVAAILASVRTLRRPVVQQWRRTTRRPSRRGYAIDAVVIALAGAGLWQLWGGRSDQGAVAAAQGRSTDALALVAPTLLALAGALLGARVLPLLAGLVARATRGSQHVGLFIGTRELARRPGGTRLVVVLTTSFALTTFSILGAAVFAANRADRAGVEVGATRVIEVDPYGGGDVLSAVRRLDPDGSQAMPVASVQSSVFGATSADQQTSSGPSRDAFTLLAVDQTRLARNAFWRADFARLGLSGLAATISGGVRRQVPVRGRQLRLRLSSSVACCGPVAVEADIVGPDQHAFVVRLGTVRPGLSQPAAPIPQCVKATCTIRRLAFSRAGTGAYPVVMDVSLLGIDARDAAGWHPLPGVVDPALWVGFDDRDPPASEPVVHVQRQAAALRMTATVPLGVLEFGVANSQPAAVPVVATSAYAPAEGTPAYLVSVPTGAPLAVQVRGLATVLPAAGDHGMLVPLDALSATRAVTDDGILVNQVWLGPKATANFPQRLAKAGVSVIKVTSIAGTSRQLAREGPSLAVSFLLAGAVAAAVLAVGAAIVTMYLVARRRAFELAALRALGFPWPKVFAAAITEQLVVALFAVLLGVALGVVGARLGLPGIPEFADASTVPPLLIPLDPARILAVAVLLTLALGAGIAGGGLLLLRTASPARLREGQV